ncbi:NAD(P)-dependent dehydrogenase (short-subunit alcohol dehydrogenase family) [Yoonia maricola]|uniref:NAD(P)-dependent dehydrogenase (Short-subunit alcohol dehydrogenase family) n=1 Tax=Yoonia maricola TaxID=420999 RepID=A0A2M8WM94_9RHOB|nr:SDR family NAD(P)-dependent oxidoreductase [Yoonia maricola]PJI92045.1 NAD(P)-dependent dehydrogenase (short-subunit alcohol dehydrogenase family) [Yoonia maricola]
MQMKDVSAIITGGASGLGAATAEAFVAAGATVTIFDRDRAGADFANRIGAAFAQVDVTDETSVTAGLDQAGAINVAINCAGIATAEKTLGRDGPHRQDSFTRTIDINLNGTFNVARLAAARIGPGGVIINTASVAAFDGQKGQAAYAASKAGIAGLSLPMARDLARNGIRVMAIAPGIFRTPMLESLGQEVMDGLAQDVTYPARLGDPAEFAALARFIVECDYLNGTTIRLDGALRMP